MTSSPSAWMGPLRVQQLALPTNTPSGLLGGNSSTMALTRSHPRRARWLGCSVGDKLTQFRHYSTGTIIYHCLPRPGAVRLDPCNAVLSCSSYRAASYGCVPWRSARYLRTRHDNYILTEPAYSIVHEECRWLRARAGIECCCTLKFACDPGRATLASPIAAYYALTFNADHGLSDGLNVIVNCSEGDGESQGSFVLIWGNLWRG